MSAQHHQQNSSSVSPARHQDLGVASTQPQAAAMYGPVHHDCTPQCTYKCESPKCNEVCTPVCQAPVCQTRCAGADLSACHMQCGKPQCSVLCPKEPLGSQACKTQCSEPMCMLQCPKAQPCHNVCEHPQCDWKCSAPTECPKPKCRMECESPQKCIGTTYRQLPPLQVGESLVQSFRTPSSLVQRSSSTRDAFEAESVPIQRSQLPTLSVPVETMRVSEGGDSLATERQQLLQRPRLQRQQATAASSEQRTLEMPVMMANSLARQ